MLSLLRLHVFRHFRTGLMCCTSKPEVKPAGKVKTYAVKRYIKFTDRYLDKFENRFEKKYPKAFRIYKLFKDGEYFSFLSLFFF